MVTRETAGLELLRKFELLRETKNRYLAGSKDAYQYNQSQTDYRKLQRVITADLEGANCPSIRELSYLCGKIQALVQHHLEYLLLENSNVFNLSLVVEHVVLPFPEFEARQIMRVEEEDEERFGKTGSECEPRYCWRFDYQQFLISYFRRLPINCNWSAEERALRQSAFEEKWGEAVLGIYPFLILLGKEESEPMTFREFSRRGDFWKGDKIAFWATYDTILDADYAPPLDPDLITKENHDTLWLKIYQDLEGSFDAFMDVANNFNPLAPSAEELELLDSSKLYDTAERELTLGYLEVERRVAFGAVLEARSGFSLDPETSGAHLVDRAIKREISRLKAQLARRQRLQKLEAPPEVIQNEEKMVQKTRYILLSLHQNRPWLIEFFSK